MSSAGINVTNLCVSEMTLLIALTAVSAVCAMLLLFVILLFASKRFRRGFFRSDHAEPEKHVEPKAIEPVIQSQPTQKQAEPVSDKPAPTYVTNSPRRTGEHLNTVTRPINGDRIRTGDARTGNRVRTSVPITDSDFDPVLTVPLDFSITDKPEKPRKSYERPKSISNTNGRTAPRVAQNMQTRDPVPTVALPSVNPEKGGTYVPRTVPRTTPTGPVTNTVPRRPVRSTDKTEK